MGFTTHPVWRVGFRPFFLLACLAGMLLPPLWALIFAGVMAPPDSPVPPVQWHAHEMFYGFGWAMLAGFLLTASKNWVGIRGYHGAPLAYLAAAWLVDRTVMAFGGSWPGWLQAACSQLFIVAAAAMLMARWCATGAATATTTTTSSWSRSPRFLSRRHLCWMPDTSRRASR